MTRPISLYQVDAFTDQPYKGNPACVCLLADPADETWMQLVAREMNVSETTFLHPFKDGYKLRWFSPIRESNLCGHATLASAHILWETGHLAKSREVRFQTKAGELLATYDDGWIELNFPASPAKELQVPAWLETALGAPVKYFGKNSAPEIDYIAELPDENAVENLTPNFSQLSKLDGRGIIVTAPASGGAYDFISRFFSADAGTPEDPVTGSAHCTLGPYWGAKWGRTVMTGYQASDRGGAVRVELWGDRVNLGGRAVTIAKIELTQTDH